MSTVIDDPLTSLEATEVATLRAVADRLIPAAGEMPSGADVLTDARLRFVLNARPDLLGPLRAALRPDLGDDVAGRLDALGRDEPATLYALQLVIVGGYYTDSQVRDLIGYPGQMALELRSWEFPAYLEEGLIDAVLARGPVWRDPSTGRRAVVADAPQTYAERYAAGEAASNAGASGEGGQ
ncbi:MAG TPA: hypothetical protein VFN41_08350 [Candidatus Limnocylindrales bacterium]|nr:hypothetical protein [Candidatus Limnocylindrales bacterium]